MRTRNWIFLAAALATILALVVALLEYFGLVPQPVSGVLVGLHFPTRQELALGVDSVSGRKVIFVPVHRVDTVFVRQVDTLVLHQVDTVRLPAPAGMSAVAPTVIFGPTRVHMTEGKSFMPGATVTFLQTTTFKYSKAGSPISVDGAVVGITASGGISITQRDSDANFQVVNKSANSVTVSMPASGGLPLRIGGNEFCLSVVDRRSDENGEYITVLVSQR